MQSKGLLYFKDGHTEEILDVSLFYDRDEPTCVTYITTTSGCYTFSESLSYEILNNEKLFNGPLTIAHRCIQFFQKVFENDGKPYLVAIDDIEQVALYDKDVITAFI